MGKQGKRESFKAKVADFFELPSEIILDLPRLVLTGKQRLLVENHQGIKEYTKEMIKINTSAQELIINGQDLKIITIAQEEIRIEGQIDKIEWGKRGESE